MEQTLQIIRLLIIQDARHWQIDFSTAKLEIVERLGSVLWYLDIEDVSPLSVLEKFNRSDNIRIELIATDASGRQYEGVGYLHPNLPNQAAVIRGDGELSGLADILA